MPAADPDTTRLLHGPYRLPQLRKGDRAVCLSRDGPVVVTSLVETRLGPWPRCRRPDSNGGGSGLLVDEELTRAVRRESVAALCHWWRVSRWVVWRWRAALGVPALNEGSARLHRRTSKSAAAARVAGGRRPHGRAWSPGELALLGKLPDRE
jgi:hypothetical protein